MSEPLERLPPDIETLLDAERELPPEDTALKERVLRGVTVAVGGPAGGEPEGGATGGDGDSGAGTAASGADAAAQITSGAVGAGASATKAIVGVGVAAFLAGGLAGSALTTSMLRTEAPAPPPPVVVAPTTSVAVPRPVEPELAPTSSSPAEPTSTPKAGTSARAPASSKAKASHLDRERELLDVARGALGRGNAEGALEALAEHTEQFPGAQLGEERHALMVQALAAAGRTTEARTVAEQFRARYPTSMLRPVVDAASPPKP